MEGRIDDARLHALGDLGVQRNLAGAARQRHQIAVAHAALFGVEGMDFEHVLLVPEFVGGATCLRADVILRQDAPGRQQKREARSDALLGGEELGQHELALAAHEAVDMHDRRARRRRIVARPLDRAEFVEAGVGHAFEGRRGGGDLVHDLARVGVAHRRADRVGERHRRFPVGQAGEGRNRPAHPADAALGVDERAVLFQKRRAGQKHMGVARRLVQEEVLHHDAFHRAQARGDVPGVGIGLGDVLALNVEPLERALDRFIDHVGNAQARLLAERHAPHAARTSRAPHRSSHDGSRKTRAGTSPCRMSPARCSGRAAD